ncbi:OLC1v1031370C1 [Oldenlandia corymbosa var. corymbosa]|uniref:OLC1v1031370C1 n=1 Tax=Oldenlandia corymbosa var. corymbosa TaxID=529605 RepID=A0AAV1CLN8_OLDCO|nr:OLC1v1031370C1 [Oldenlandia corymbosa var. corymbosa]
MGPNFPTTLENLKEYIPLLCPKGAYHKYENPCKFESFDGIRVWPWSDKPKTHEALVGWYNQLEPEYGDTWRMANIYDLLQFCTVGLAEHRDLVAAMMGFWSGTSNVFCFLWGPMTLALLDVCVITGLHAVAAVTIDGKVTDDDTVLAAAGQTRSYGPFISENKGKLSHLHRICFLALWLNRYVFPGKYFQMTMDWYYVAGRLASREQLNLAEALLATLYRSLHETWHNPGSTLFGPVWLLHFRLYMYFPNLKAKGIYLVDSGESLCLVVQQYVKPKYNGTQAFKIVFESSPGIGVMVQQLHDWWHKSFGNIYHTEAESGRWDNIGIYRNYLANMVAHQFGFAQSVLHFEVSGWNTGKLGREKLTMGQYESPFGVEGYSWKNFSNNPKFCFDVTPGFAECWGELANTMYGSGYEAVKTAFLIGKYTNPKPLQPKLKRFLKGKEENPVNVDGSDDQSNDKESDKGFVAIGESIAVKKAVSAFGGTKKSEKNKLLSEQLVDQAAKLESKIKEKMAEEADLVAKLEKVQTKRVELESALGSIVTETDVALSEYGSMTETVAKLHPKYQDPQQMVKGAQASWNFLKSTITHLMQNVGIAPNSPATMDQLQRDQQKRPSR